MRLFVVGQGEEPRLIVDLDDVSSVTAGPVGARLADGQNEFHATILTRSGGKLTASMSQSQVDDLVRSLEAKEVGA